MLLAAPDGRVLRVNRALCELTGRTAPELARRAFRELLHPNDRGADSAALAAMVEGRTQRLAAERRVLVADGGTCMARINLSLIRDAAGTPLHFVGQVEDVTERRRMIEALTLSEARYKGLVAHLPDSAVFLIDPDLRIVLAEGDKLLGAGYEPADVEGKAAARRARRRGVRAPGAEVHRRAGGRVALVRHALGHHGLDVLGADRAAARRAGPRDRGDGGGA